MKRTVFFFLISFSALCFGKECKHTDNSFKCVKYVRNYDADTITFNIPGTHPLIGEKMNIRVFGVDTPELRTKNKCEKEMGYKAKRFVTSLLKKAKRVDLEEVERGKYFRVVAKVKIDGEDLSEKLLENGLAYPYFGKTKEKIDWCKPLRFPASKND